MRTEENMMREILFRGKRTDNGAWVEGAFCLKDCDDPFGDLVDRPSIIKYDPPCDGFWFRVYPETVGQFTGLIVKGKLWFEHDIISVRDGGEEIYRFVITFGVCGGVQNVKHTVGYMGFHFIPANEETRCCMDAGARNDPLYWLNAYDCEVIGNIHDNPELLGGAEDGKVD